jgi:hypothetical protein
MVLAASRRYTATHHMHEQVDLVARADLLYSLDTEGRQLHVLALSIVRGCLMV